jgi:hypothetical protein
MSSVLECRELMINIVNTNDENSRMHVYMSFTRKCRLLSNSSRNVARVDLTFTSWGYSDFYVDST